MYTLKQLNFKLQCIKYLTNTAQKILMRQVIYLPLNNLTI